MARPAKLTREQVEGYLSERAALPKGGKMAWYKAKAIEHKMSMSAFERYMNGYSPISHLLSLPHRDLAQKAPECP